MEPTKEQQIILDHANNTEDCLMINALAGCGKSTTLEMIDAVNTTRPSLYLAFNKKVADDAVKRFASTTTVRTFNALGHRAWAKTQGIHPSINPKKVPDLLRQVIDEVPKRSRDPLWDTFWPVVHGVALAKALGYVPEGKFPQATRLISQSSFHLSLEEVPDDLTADLIDLVLFRSIQAAYKGNLDYNDQVYMPAVFGSVLPKFPLVLVDEAQDLNPTNHALLQRLVTVRTIIVGDPHQSIYGFRGAVQSGMAALAQHFATTPLDLSVSFRCPSTIVKAARWRVPHFKWHKEGGHVEALRTLDYGTIPEQGVFLCRNNAPLVALAFRLLSAGRPIRLAGSDIGPKLIGILRRLGHADLSRSSTLSAIADWQAERAAKNNTSASDMADCMRILANQGTTLGSAISYAEYLFKQTGSISLMTGHKAKGLEWPVVYHLDPFLCRDDEQDQNLRYVIITRSQDRYYEVNSRDVQWN